MEFTLDTALEIIDIRVEKIHVRLEDSSLSKNEYDILVANLQEIEELKAQFLKHRKKTHMYKLDDEF